jgi:spermidine synthase
MPRADTSPRHRWQRVFLLAASLILAGSASPSPGEKLVHTERSAWQTLFVTDSETRRCLRFEERAGALNQSCQWLDRPDHLVFDYTRAMVAVLLLWQPSQRVLLIGVGGGSIPKALAVTRPGTEIDAVDIDAAVLQVAQRYFDLAPGPRLRLHAADGRAFVAAARARGEMYDAVLLDAFDAEGIPPELFNDDFLRDVRAVLPPSGVFLANTFATSRSYAHESAATERVFGRYYSVRSGGTGGNRLIVAAADPARLPSPARLMDELPVQATALARIGIDAAWVRQLSFGSRD